jgi:hypothetical protein
MKIVSKFDLTNKEKDQIYNLWNTEYPEKLSFKSPIEFDNYLNNLSNVIHYTVQDEFGLIQAWAITFIRENEKWFAIIINSNFHRKGIGTQILNLLKSLEINLSGWVIDHNRDLKLDGTSYLSPIDFYMKNGFSICNDIRIKSEKISALKIVWKKY